MNVGALDLSITSPGLAVSDYENGPTCRTRTLKTNAKDGDFRLHSVDQAIREEFLPADVRFVLIEGPMFASKSAFISGMVHGVARMRLMEEGLKYGVVPPTSLKKYATGSGNADKTLMAVEAVRRFDRMFRTSDECDAFWLWIMAMDFKGQAVIKMPEINRQSLLKIEEPAQ